MPAKHPSLTIRPRMGPNEYPDLVEIRRSAVRATHDFPAGANFARIESLPVLLRPYAERDAAKTLAVFLDSVTQITSADYTADQVRSWARPDERDPETWHLEMSRRNSFVATVEGDVVGFSDVSSAGFIDMMFVAPALQRRGIAGLLLAEATRQARDARASNLSANVSIRARPFFERHGFQIEQVQRQTRAGVTLSNFSMRKSLLEAG